MQPRLRSGLRLAPRPLGLLAALLTLTGSSVLQAEAPTEIHSLAQGEDAIRIDDADPEGSVPAPEQAMKRPLEMGYFIMELSDRAEAAKKRGDHAQAAKYYRAMAKAVPDRAVSFSKACAAHEAAGQWLDAAEMCRAALGLVGVKLEDHARFVRATLRKPGPIASSDLDDMEAVIRELRSHATTPETKTVLAELECELATRLEDRARTRGCIAQLKELGREPIKTKVYEWALALMEQDEQAARDVLVKAKAVGATASALASMQRELEARFGPPGDDASDDATAEPMLSSWLPIAVACLAIAIVAAGIGTRRRRGREA